VTLGRNFKKGSFCNFESFNIDEKGGANEGSPHGYSDFELDLLAFVISDVSFQEDYFLAGSDSDK
jgi:hypothetical protein